VKRVLVTGVGGFVGSHLLRHLLTTTDWHVVGLDSFRHHGKLDRIQYQLEGQDRSRYTHLVYDLSIPFSDQFVERIGHIDYVLNLASESHVERSIEDPRPFVENNVALMLTLLEWARYENGIEKFIQISTDETMGPILAGGHKEGAPHRPSNPYSASKAMQEDLAYSYWRTYGVPVVITNTMNLIGPLQDPEKFVPKVIRAIGRGDTVPVHADKDGVPGTRFYLHAESQADALVFLLGQIGLAMYPADDLDRFNVVSGVELDNLSLAHLIAEFMGKSLTYELVDFHISRPGHDRRYGLDGSKMAALGWTPPGDFYDQLRSTVEWFVAHPEWLL
jgi:dTDP-glucose 4,6-dehydratase